MYNYKIQLTCVFNFECHLYSSGSVPSRDFLESLRILCVFNVNFIAPSTFLASRVRDFWFKSIAQTRDSRNELNCQNWKTLGYLTGRRIRQFVDYDAVSHGGTVVRCLKRLPLPQDPRSTLSPTAVSSSIAITGPEPGANREKATQKLRCNCPAQLAINIDAELHPPEEILCRLFYRDLSYHFASEFLRSSWVFQTLTRKRWNFFLYTVFYSSRRYHIGHDLVVLSKNGKKVP